MSREKFTSSTKKINDPLTPLINENKPQSVSHLVERGADYKKESSENEYTPSKEVEEYFAEKRNQNRASQKRFEKMKIPFADDATIEEITKNTPPGSTFEDTDFIYEVTKQKENGVFSFKKTHKATGARSVTSMKPETLADKIEQRTMKPSEHKTPENTTEMHDRVTWHKKMKPLAEGAKEPKPQDIPNIDKVSPTPEKASSKQEKGQIAIGDMFMDEKKHVYKVTGFADDGKIILIRKESGKRKYDSSAVLEPKTVLTMKKIEDEKKKGVDSPKEKIGFEKILTPGKKFLDTLGHEIIIKAVKKEVFTYTIAQNSNIQTETIENFNEYIENREWKEVNNTETTSIEPDTDSIGASETKWSLKNELKKLGWSDSDIKKLSGEEKLHIYENQITVEDASPTEEQSIKQNIPLPRHLEHIPDWKDREISKKETNDTVEFRFKIKNSFGSDAVIFKKSDSKAIEEFEAYLQGTPSTKTVEKKWSLIVNPEAMKKKITGNIKEGGLNWPEDIYDILSEEEKLSITKTKHFYTFADLASFEKRIREHKIETLGKKLAADTKELEEIETGYPNLEDELEQIRKTKEAYDKKHSQTSEDNSTTTMEVSESIDTLDEKSHQAKEKIAQKIETIADTYGKSIDENMEKLRYEQFLKKNSGFKKIIAETESERTQIIENLEKDKVGAEEKEARVITEEIEELSEVSQYLERIIAVHEFQEELTYLIKNIESALQNNDWETVTKHKIKLKNYLLHPLKEIENRLEEHKEEQNINPEDKYIAARIKFYELLEQKIISVLRSK